MLQAINNTSMSPRDGKRDRAPLFERCITAEKLWRDYGKIRGNVVPGTPEDEPTRIADEVLSDAYEALFREYCDFAVEHPSNETLRNVVVLWRLRCWDDDVSLGGMEDDFEARAIVRISEALSGSKS